MKSVALFGAIASLAFVLSGCDGKSSAVAGRGGGSASRAPSSVLHALQCTG